MKRLSRQECLGMGGVVLAAVVITLLAVGIGRPTASDQPIPASEIIFSPDSAAFEGNDSTGNVIKGKYSRKRKKGKKTKKKKSRKSNKKNKEQSKQKGAPRSVLDEIVKKNG